MAGRRPCCPACWAPSMPNPRHYKRQAVSTTRRGSRREGMDGNPSSDQVGVMVLAGLFWSGS